MSNLVLASFNLLKTVQDFLMGPDLGICEQVLNEILFNAVRRLVLRCSQKFSRPFSKPFFEQSKKNGFLERP